MWFLAAGFLIVSLPLLLAAGPVKPPASKAPARTAPAKSSPVKPPPKVAATPQTEDFNIAKTYPPETVTFANGVVMNALVYSAPPGFRPLTADLYLPPGKTYPRPGLIFVHGGGWNSGDSRHAASFGDFPGLLASVAARGFVVASLNYRLSAEAQFPAALLDVKNGIRWLRAHAAEYNVDETRIAIWGDAEGGHLAAMAGVTCGVGSLEPPSSPDAKPPSDCVQAVIDWYGITDLEALFTDLGKTAPDKSEAGAFLGCEPALCPVGVARNAGPLTYVEAMSPPFLIQHGADDSVVSPKQSQKLYDALRAKDVPAELVVYPGVGHGFMPSSGANPFDAATNRQAVEKLEAFLDATFPNRPVTTPYQPEKPKPLPY
jgi:acetyl esterase/lipase